MSVYANPNIVTSNLLLNLDAFNPRSYPGSGSIWTDVSNTGQQFTLQNSSYYSYTSLPGSINFTRTTPPTTILGGYAQATMSGNLAVSTYLYNNHTTEVWAKINDINFTNYNATETASSLILYVGYHSMFYYTNTYLTYGIWSGISSTVGIPGLSVGTSGTNIVQGTWFQVVVTVNYSGGNVTLTQYLNGAYGAATTTTAPSNVGIGTTNTLRISAGNNASPTGSYNWYANQNISCVRMYNSVLTANQIAQNFNALRSRFGI